MLQKNGGMEEGRDSVKEAVMFEEMEGWRETGREKRNDRRE